MKWEKITAFVQRDERTGAIIRLEEAIPCGYLVELEEHRRKVTEWSKDAKEKRQD